MSYQEKKLLMSHKVAAKTLLGSLDRTRPSGLGFGTYTHLQKGEKHIREKHVNFM